MDDKTRKEAPIPPNGTRNRYEVECMPKLPGQTRWALASDGTFDLTTARVARRETRQLGNRARIVARDAQGRKVVVK